MEYFRGKTLKQHAETKENKHKEIEKLVAVQREIQEKNPAGLTDMRVQMGERIERSGLDSEIKEKLLQKMAMMPVRKCLCHGELDLSNIIISDSPSPSSSHPLEHKETESHIWLQWRRSGLHWKYRYY